MDRGAWWPTVHGVAESWTWLSALTKEEMEENAGGPEGEFDLKMSTGSLFLPATCLQPQVEVEFCP